MKIKPHINSVANSRSKHLQTTVEVELKIPVTT